MCINVFTRGMSPLPDNYRAEHLLAVREKLAAYESGFRAHRQIRWRNRSPADDPRRPATNTLSTAARDAPQAAFDA
jgi:hypothetical protein